MAQTACLFLPFSNTQLCLVLFGYAQFPMCILLIKCGFRDESGAPIVCESLKAIESFHVNRERERTFRLQITKQQIL